MRRQLVRALAVAVGMAAASCLAPVAPASAANNYYVTFVARNCTSYGDIYANKARNDIVESLQDLGPNSQYGGSASLVSPAFEDLAPQTNCVPLPDWTFTLGTGYQTRAVTGVWGSLSRVTGPYPTSIVTSASTPLLDDHGNQVAGQTVAGAVTIKLTDAQVQQASTSSSLWAQGGTPNDPVLASQFGTPQAPDFGFGTVRCATDNVNGDNVEYIFFPSGTTHVFCYGYYVSPPPTSGTIVIHKQVLNTPQGPDPAFHFSGGRTDDVSYDPNGFTLKDGQATSAFYRAGSHDWRVTEDPAANYTLDRVECTATTGTGGTGTSVTTFDPGTRTETISLVAGERVDCTFVNAFQEPLAPLTITKITEGGASAGSREPFEFTVSHAGGGAAAVVTAQTTAPGVPANAGPDDPGSDLASLGPGDYTVAETGRPVDLRGAWELVSEDCSAVTPRIRAVRHLRLRDPPVTIPPAGGRPQVCTFINRLTAPGAINLSKVTVGGTGTAAFVIQSTSGEIVQYHQHATTTTPHVPADAVPNRGTIDETGHIPWGAYWVIERPPLTTASGTWALTAVQCDGVDVPFSQGAVHVTLTRAHPHANCRFTNTLTHGRSGDPEPGESGAPRPPTSSRPGGTRPDPGNVWANLAVSTQPQLKFLQTGRRVDDRIVVTNHGPSDAEGVMLDYQAPRGSRLISVQGPAGRCSRALPLTCRLGILKPGHRMTLTVVLASSALSRDFTMHAAVGSSTDDPHLSNNMATERVAVRTAPTPAPPPFTG